MTLGIEIIAFFNSASRSFAVFFNTAIYDLLFVQKRDFSYKLTSLGFKTAMLQADSKLCEGVCGVSTLPSLEEISSANRAFANSFETDAGKKIASSMFREGDQFPGGTAAALRFEAQTGSFLSPSGHGIKAQNMLNQFNNALSNGILSPNDIARLSPKLDELSSALKSFSNKFNK